ncbi:toprim domain-containing protein [Agrobacterium sp. S2/73]|uniref:CHC2 zinc finger domain-containing protein n=1 Tax=unclassified Agrobacterium TaxID=2632611 RepID=UPI001ADD47C1|nr:CHC2 zinc finger domain-containing protein [Agrobacterium sp. S7/73]MBO9110000.1 toprim domain-containing protein [Agrobacterium sp. S2/73]QXZ73958.1 toprim domain-containing protein [Agrobacterium sp. S7/73]
MVDDWKYQVGQLKISDVAERLGIQVAASRRSPKVALCPFHDDTTPSLRLFEGENPHYHCFSCHAHGDTVELVKQRLGLEFVPAIDWLAANFSLELDRKAIRRSTGRQGIYRRALEFWRAQEDGATLKKFADARRFEVDQLRDAGLTIGVVGDFLTTLRGDRESEDEAISVGLAHLSGTGDAAIRSTSLSPFAQGTQLIIPLATPAGQVVGVMARKLAGEGPKYRFTAGFKKSEILFGADRVRRSIEKAKNLVGSLDAVPDRFDLFICEGVFDALRLQSFGFAAVSSLGSSLSDKQVQLLSGLSRDASVAGAVLRVHLFYDADQGGRRGIADNIPRLLRAGAEDGFLVDVVGFDRPEEEKADPDSLLIGLNPNEAAELLRGALTSALHALASVSLNQPFADTPSMIDTLDPSGSIMLQNRLARRLRGLDWQKIWIQTAPDRTTLNMDPALGSPKLSRTFQRLAREAEKSGLRDSISRSLPVPYSELAQNDDASLFHALILARESTDSREYPVDVAAWDRIEEAAPLFLQLIEDELGAADRPTRPYLAHYEPKDSGAPRLKCGPSPEDAIQQQYILTELLRVRPDRSDIAERIPAVRYWSDRPDLVVTGLGGPTSPVSFGYQVDMRALEERPDRTRRRDMFRPFLDCWNSFILHIGRRIDRMEGGLIHIARLDVKGFYDHVPRHAIEAILRECLPDVEALDAAGIAPLFGTALVDGDRREALINWVLEHSFGSLEDGYTYACPGKGIAVNRQSGSKGLPQGPALSSYLANIVLFGLDAELEQRVSLLDQAVQVDGNSKARGGLYARYVDDIIIAARTPEDLRALRSSIEVRLEKLGLELNDKSEHLEPMSAEEARNWVVERRGAGFVSYGEVDDQPSPAADVRTGWADIPSLDRRTALSLLYWSAFDDPEQTSREAFDEMLTKIAGADDLRQSDLGHIARRILLRASLEIQNEAPEATRTSADAFEAHVRTLFGCVSTAFERPLRVKTKDRPVAEALAAARPFLSVLAGLDRVILGKPENNPTFSAEVRNSISKAKADIVSWILNNNLLDRFQDFFIKPEDQLIVRKTIGAQLELQRATLEERAARAVRLRNVQLPANFKVATRSLDQAPNQSSSKSVRIGWLRTFAPSGLANPQSDDARLIFHTIAAEVQTASEDRAVLTDLGELPPHAIADAVLGAANAALASLALPARGSEIAQAFLTLAGSKAALSDAFRMRAVASFLGLSDGPNKVPALLVRPELIATIADNSLIIPLPPIAGQPGIFCFDPDVSEIRAIIVTGDTDPLDHLPPELAWEPAGMVSGLRTFAAPLPQGTEFLLDPQTNDRVIKSDLGMISEVFEGLLRTQINHDSALSPLVHVFGLIGPVSSVGSQVESPYFCLCWRLERAAVEQLVFERRGNSVAVQRSPHAGADLWRIGQAVADLFAIADETDEETGIKNDRARLEDRLKRMAFSRLKGRWINGAQVAAAQASKETPRAITRTVNALKEAAESGDGFGPLALEFLLSGRAMRIRMQVASTDAVPGSWARFLELLGLRTLANGDDEGLFDQPVVQTALARPVRALIRAGDALSGFANRADVDRCRHALETTALGFELAAFRSQLRDFVLASLARMSVRDLDRLSNVRPNLSTFGTPGAAVLVEPRFADSDAGEATYELGGQTQLLFPTLLEALELRSLPGRAKIERISLTGWLVIACVMTGAIDFEMDGSGPTSDQQPRPSFFALADTHIAEPLRRLGLHLLSLFVDERDAADPVHDAWPWELASSIDRPALRDVLARARDALISLAADVGIIQNANPLPLRSLRFGDPQVEFVDANGEQYALPWWRCSLASTINERIDRVETRAGPNNRLVTPCSVLTDTSGNILLVQLVSESLSRITGLENQQEEGGIEYEGSSSAIESETTTPKSVDAATLPAPVISSAGQVLPPATSEPVLTQTEDRLGQRIRSQAPEFRHLQRTAWTKRGAKSGIAQSGYGRVAILQYDFVDSYYPETTTQFRLGGDQVKSPRILAGAVDYQLSFEEHRRRRVLEEVLACCDSFQVEALVLPEYSVRPETVNWAQQHCQLKGYKTSIWAGTFRQQHGFELALTASNDEFLPVAPGGRSDIQSMEAVISVLFRETQKGATLAFNGKGLTNDEAPIYSLALPENLRYRRKKYPSIGMYEDFKPSREPLSPLMASSRSLNRIESFVSELVCSELFVFNGPLNWNNFAQHLDASCERYNMDAEQWLELMVRDSTTAAAMFSGQDGHKPRRTLLFLPCATSRDVDYHYFAQSAYLASGIVTAFCNSSHYPALGGSCFVGASGWETRNAPQIASPYHGAAPGMLSVNNPNRGALGQKENALIIGDIRPERTVEDRPRSQTSGPPMRLVAHIPILEAHRFVPVEGQWDRQWWHPVKAGWLDPNDAKESLLDPSRHNFLLHQTSASSRIGIDEFSARIASFLQVHASKNTAQLNAAERRELVAAALSLANLYHHSPGMAYRAKTMVSGLQAMPEAFPSPALVDWMVVDLELDEFQEQLTELSTLSGEIDADQLSPSLREAAWHWIAPQEFDEG